MTAADFRLFLCHLYLSHHCCFAPFLPLDDIDLEAEHPRLSCTFPSASPSSIDRSNFTQLRSTPDDESFVHNESLLSLAYYFDCATMMKQCEAVMMTKAAYGEANEDSEWLTLQCLDWLEFADCYKLQRWKAACVRIIAAYPNVLPHCV